MLRAGNWWIPLRHWPAYAVFLSSGTFVEVGCSSSGMLNALYPEQVRSWERTLNHVIETLDVWYTVQRKWMYLESIFVGAEDIRLQLPEEAKKFDAIDKAFKQVTTELV